MISEDVRFITTSSQPEWNEAIEWGVQERLFQETEEDHDFDRFSIYAVLDILEGRPIMIGGALLEVQGTSLWVDGIWVAPSFRKSGIGAKICDFITGYGLQHRRQTIQLNTYFKENLDFFKKQGFQEVACIPNWKYDLDCYFMRKNL